MTGENIASDTRPPRYGQGEISQRRSFGTLTSQIRIAGPKNSAVYFDNNAAPTAAPTASHHPPRPVPVCYQRCDDRPPNRSESLQIHRLRQTNSPDIA